MRLKSTTSAGRNFMNMEDKMGPVVHPVNRIVHSSAEMCVPNPFERLVEILKTNERLLGELQHLNGRLEEARDYLVRPGCNVVLGMATLDRAKRRRSAVLCRLRAHRMEADGILGGRQWRDASIEAATQVPGSPHQQRHRNDS